MIKLVLSASEMPFEASTAQFEKALLARARRSVSNERIAEILSESSGLPFAYTRLAMHSTEGDKAVIRDARKVRKFLVWRFMVDKVGEKDATRLLHAGKKK